MIRPNTWVYSLAGMLCASAPVGQAVAQGESGVALEEVMVTASRREQSLQDVPASVITFNPEKFLKTGLTSIEDMIDYSPGANFVNESATGQGQIVLRGIGQEGVIPVTGIYIDDVPITSASPFSAASSFFFDGLLGDLERIEIVKGPQGTLYGAGAMGGVVKYVTRDPATDEMRGNFSADVSTTRGGDTSELYRAMVSVPLIEDRLGITLAGFRNDKGGYIDRLSPATLDVVAEDYNTAEISGFSAAILWNINDRARLKFSGLRQETETFGTNEVALFSPDLGISRPDFTRVDGKLVLAANDPGSVGLDYTAANATFNYDFGWSEFTAVSGYAEYETPTVTDQGTVPGLNAFIDTILGVPLGTTTGIPTTFFRDSTRYVQELRLSSFDSDKVEWIAGAFYAHEETNNIQDVRALPSGISLIDVSFPSTYEELAFFGDVTWYMTPEIDFTVGIRYSENSLDSEFDFSGFLVGPQNVTKADVDDEVATYLFNARWRPSDDMSLYASVASGYRPAYVNTPITDPNTGVRSSTVIDSDSLWNYEIGIKGVSFEDRLTYELSVWYADWEDFQSSLRLGGVNTGGNSDSPVVAAGFEASMQLRLTSQLDMALGLAHVNSELEGDSPALGALDGEKTRDIPDWTASLQGNFHFTLGSVSGTSTLGVRYVGDYNTVYLGGYSSEFDLDVNLGTFEFPIDDYFLVDFNTEFTRGNISLNVYANNLLNEYTYLNGETVNAGTGVSAVGFANEPRRIGVAVSYKF